VADELIMEYTEYIPISALAPYVKCIWTLDAAIDEPEPVFERIFPDGHPELIFHFGAPFDKKNGAENYIQDQCFVYGQLSTYIELKPSRNASVLGVRFATCGLAAFTRLPQYEMTGREVAPEKVFPGQTALYDQLQLLLPDQRIDHVQQMLGSLLDTGDTDARNKETRSVQQCIQMMRDAENPMPSAALAKQLHISIRELERRFREYVGLSPKQLARIFRFQEVLQKKYIASSLTEVAHSSGYYDQSHFIRDFKAFSGLSPAGFFKQEKGFTDFFISH
jgi:AraC-like DNA-binding protein